MTRTPAAWSSVNATIAGSDGFTAIGTIQDAKDDIAELVKIVSGFVDLIDYAGTDRVRFAVNGTELMVLQHARRALAAKER